jgi:hypothetical protein
MSTVVIFPNRERRGPPSPIVPLADLRCRSCKAPVDQHGAVFAIVGQDVRPWCCIGHAMREGWPWIRSFQPPARKRVRPTP